MRPVPVVMFDELSEHTFQMPRVEDQQPVQTFRPGRTNEALREGVRLRCSDRRSNDAEALALKHGIEAPRELLVAITDQHTNGFRPFSERPCDVTGLLRHPVAVRMRRAAGEMDAPCCKFDEEQRVHPLQPERFDGEEIYGDQTASLRSDEVAAHEHQRTTPVAIVTGDSFFENAVSNELRELGAKVYFKPIWLDDLVQITESLVNVLH